MNLNGNFQAETSFQFKSFNELLQQANKTKSYRIKVLDFQKPGQIVANINLCKNKADNLYNNKDLENAFIEYYFLKNITITELAKGKYSQNDLQKYETQLEGIKKKVLTKMKAIENKLKIEYKINYASPIAPNSNEDVPNTSAIRNISNGNNHNLNNENILEDVEDDNASVVSSISFPTIQPEFFQRYVIQDGETNYSYKRIFQRCLKENFTEVVVIDPYIITQEQVQNFLMFCVMLVDSQSMLANIKLITKRNAGNVKNLSLLKNSLMETTKVDLQIEINNRIHYRQIRFNNGWVVEIDRGLDIYKDVSPFTVGYIKQQFRPCKETLLQILKYE